MYKRYFARLAMLLTAAFLIKKWRDSRGRMRFSPMRRGFGRHWLSRMQMNMDLGRTMFRVMGNRLMRRMAR
ncbi:MAG: hypothetical protein AB2404_07460 [Planifilum fimeticola]|jgi:hypothetical protein